jgi:hypothetical protein
MKKLKRLLNNLSKKSNKKLYRKVVYPTIGTIEYFFDDLNFRCETNMQGEHIFWYVMPFDYRSARQRKLEDIMKNVHPEDVTEEKLNLVALQISEI